MTLQLMPPPAARATASVGKAIAIKVFGVGGAGASVLEPLLRDDLAGIGFVAVNTDAASLATSSAAEKLHLETKLLRGMGSGGDPDRGRAAAEAHFPRLKAVCEGSAVVFVVAGLGGGAGTGIGPVLARAARETGALVLGFVTTPFLCEGSHRQRVALDGLRELKAAADGVICLPNQKVFKLIDENTSVLETFKITSEFLAEGVRGFWRLFTHSGLIDLHFDDLCDLLRHRHAESAFAVAEAMGPTRAREVTDKLLAHPMLDAGQMLSEADAVMVSLLGGPDLAMAEVNRVMEQINRQCEHAQVVMGAAIDDSFRDRLAVTLVATCRRGEPTPSEPLPVADRSGENLEGLFPGRAAPARHASRFASPPAGLPPEKLEPHPSRPGGAPVRQRKNSAKMLQTQLALEIVSRGRFDKSEPNIHQGEDLDLPTYVRRGVALN